MWDNHMHTSFSGDSEAAPADMIKEAKAKGLNGITITDHLDYDYLPEPGAFELDPDTYYKTQHALALEYSTDSFTILTGLEVGLQKCCVEKNKVAVASQDFDFIIGSTHVVDGKDPYYDSFWDEGTQTELFLKYYASILENITTFDDFDSVGHLDYIFRYARDEAARCNTYRPYKFMVDMILDQIIRKDKALEINTGAYRKGLLEPNPAIDIIKRYKDLGGKLITIGSDAHEPAHIAYGFDKVAALLKECGFKEYAVYKKRVPQMYPL